MITATGIGSGLDIEGLVSQLVAAERTPADTRLTRNEAALTAELSAFGVFKSALSGFQSTLEDLSRLSTFGQRTASSSEQDIVDIAVNGKAIAADYDVAVSQLAKAHSLASAGYTSAEDVVGNGTLTIRFGTTDYTSPDPGPESYNSFTVNPERAALVINIDNTNNTLEGVRDAINAADAGVNAVIVKDGSGYRLLLGSEETGEANSLEIAVTDTGDNNDTDIAGLSSLAFNSAATNLSQTVAAQDALFSINGLGITSASNSVSDVIDGVDLTLSDLTGLTPVSVSVNEDRESVKQAISGFVSSYNGFVGIMNELTSYDPETGIAGALQGDFSARSITSRVRETLTDVVEGFDAPFKSLAEIGITTQADGQLALDTADLDQVLENNFDQIVGLFAAVGFPSDGGIEYVGSAEATAVGKYAVNVSQLATQGLLQGAVAGFPLTIDADNDQFTLKVDGTTSASIFLTQGVFANGAELAAEMQSRINGDAALSGAGAAVTVTYNVDHFEISSNQFGAESTVEVIAVDTNTTAQLGLSIAAGTAGLDVAGTIGGLTATGSGQLLTSSAIGGPEGMKLLIEGGAIGIRGHVDFSRGIAHQLDKLLDSFLDAEGVLGSRTEGIQERIDDIVDQRETLDRRMEAVEARYRAQFNGLDALLSQLQNTSNFLTQQLANLPKPGALNNNDN